MTTGISIDPKLPTASLPTLALVNIKTAIISAIRAALDDQAYPDAKIQGINVSQEYPLEQEKYPTIWIEFSFTKLQQAGIGYQFVSNNQIKQEWWFEGDIKMTIISLSSYERDVYSSQLINMFAFSQMNPVAAKFDSVLTSYPNIYLSINRDVFQPQGQSVVPGTPWAEDIFTYLDSYSAQMMGQIDSTFTATPEFLRSIHMVGSAQIPNVDPIIVEETFGSPSSL